MGGGGRGRGRRPGAGSVAWPTLLAWLVVSLGAAALSGGASVSEGAGSRTFLTLAPRAAGLAASPAATATPLPTATAPTTPAPTATPGGAAEWTQDAHDPQRSGYTPEEPAEPWTLAWSWNGPDASGGVGGHRYDAPPEARTVTGGANIYVPAGASGLYAVAKATGQIAWHVEATSFDAAPAFDPASGSLLAGGADGRLYKLDAASGRVVQSYDAGAAIEKAVLLVGDDAYVVTRAGALHKVGLADLAPAWVYQAGSRASTPPAYSAAADRVVFATDDLYVHAVAGASGQPAWRVKPSPNPAEPGAAQPYSFDRGWPVVAERHGLVLLRMQLHQDAMYAYPSTGNIFPGDLATTRAWLDANPRYKNLFALRLSDGAEAFTPAVGYGSTEQIMSPCPYGGSGPCGAGVMGSVPVVKTFADGTEVAYVHFRSGQSAPPDYRWDGHMGEMVLDGATVPGLPPGDLRFVRMARRNGYGGTGYVDVIDEQEPLTVAGSTIFHAHWGASESVRIIDRSLGLGLTYARPIETSPHATVVRQQQTCGNFDPTSHRTTCGLTLFNDGRFWDGPGFWTYWGVIGPPASAILPIGSVGYRPHYTYVSDGLMVVEGNGGELMVFRHAASQAGRS